MDDTNAYAIAMSKSSLFSNYWVTESHNEHSLPKVLNPSICFSWIQREWDSEYIQRSKTTMLDLISA